jgi:hypothetical protein
MNWGEILKMVIPILVVSIGWLLGQVSSFNTRLIQIESKIPILITQDGVIIDSPVSEQRRQIIRQELQKEINNLHVRVTLLEERQKR